MSLITFFFAAILSIKTSFENHKFAFLRLLFDFSNKFKNNFSFVTLWMKSKNHATIKVNSNNSYIMRVLDETTRIEMHGKLEPLAKSSKTLSNQQFPQKKAAKWWEIERIVMKLNENCGYVVLRAADVTQCLFDWLLLV